MSAIETITALPAARAIGWALLHFIWQGTLVGASTALVLAFLRRGAADVRYVVACLGLVLMLTLPIVTAVERARGEDAIGPAARLVPATAVEPSAGSLRPAQGAPSVSRGSGFPDVAEGRARATWRLSDVEPWLPTAVLLWIAGVMILSLRLVSGWLLVERLRRRSTRPVAPAVAARVVAMARRLRVARPVRALESAMVEVPTVIGWLRPVILLPASALAGLSPAQLEAVIAHELAHVRRHDYLVNLLQTVVETLLFYHPAVWWLSHRIRVEREHCCDDLAVELCGDRVAYARALADLEELRGAGPAFAMAATGGSLLARVRRLLGVPTPHDRRSPAWVAMAAIVAVVGLALVEAAPRQAPPPLPPEPPTSAEPPALPEFPAASVDGLQTPPAPPAPPSPAAPPAPPASAASVRTDNGEGRISWSDGTERLYVRYRGTIALSDDDRDIAYISPGGYFIVKDGWFSTRSLELRGTADGIERKFSAGWFKQRQFDAEARDWLATTLLRLVRRTGFAAEPRVARILKSQGPSGVLAEIGRLESDYVRAVYFLKLFDQGSLSGAQLAQALSQAGRDISSSYELARLLMKQSERAMADEAARKAYLDAAGRISSDYELQRVLATAMSKPGLPPAAVAQALKTAATIDSDYELARLLMTTAKSQRLDATTRGPFFEAAALVESDYEHRRVLSAAAERTTDPAFLAGMLDSAAGLGSDYELAQFLVAVVQRAQIDRFRDAFFRAVDTIDSGYERRRVLGEVASQSDLSTDTLAALLKSAGGINSDYERATILVSIAQRHRLQGPLREAYLDAAERIASSHEQGRALIALVKRERGR